MREFGSWPGARSREDRCSIRIVCHDAEAECPCIVYRPEAVGGSIHSSLAQDSHYEYGQHGRKDDEMNLNELGPLRYKATFESRLQWTITDLRMFHRPTPQLGLRVGRRPE